MYTSDFFGVGFHNYHNEVHALHDYRIVGNFQEVNFSQMGDLVANISQFKLQPSHYVHVQTCLFYGFNFRGLVINCENHENRTP